MYEITIREVGKGEDFTVTYEDVQGFFLGITEGNKHPTAIHGLTIMEVGAHIAADNHLMEAAIFASAFRKCWDMDRKSESENAVLRKILRAMDD